MKRLCYAIFAGLQLYIYIYIYILFQEKNNISWNNICSVNLFTLSSRPGIFKYSKFEWFTYLDRIVSYSGFTGLKNTYIYIYIYNLCCRSEERIKIYFKIGWSTKRFVFFLIYLFCSFIHVIYVYVSSLLLSSENICGTRPWWLGTQWDLNALLFAAWMFSCGFHIEIILSFSLSVFILLSLSLSLSLSL